MDEEPAGDRNQDGILDDQQSDVISIHKIEESGENSTKFLTFVSDDQKTISNLFITDTATSASNTLPTNITFSSGFFNFKIEDIAVGATSQVSILLPDGATANTYWQYDPNRGWYEFLYNGTTGAEFQDKNGDGKNEWVILHLADGQRGDGDTTANGTIANLGAPGITGNPPSNKLPIIAINTGLSLNEGSTSAISNTRLQVTDADNTADEIIYTLTDLPNNGTLLLNGRAIALNSTFTQANIDNNKLSYQHNGDETTSDSFRFTVSDGETGTIAETTFTVTVNPVNDPPVVKNAIAPVTVNEDAANTTINLTNVFSDVDGDAITKSVFANTNTGLVTANIVNDQLTLDYQDNKSGTAQITVRGTANGQSVDNTFTVNVNPVNDPPVVQNAMPSASGAIADQNAKQGNAFNFQIPTNTFTDIDAGDVLAYSATLENGNALPNWLTFNPTTRTFSGTPTNDNVGNLNVKAIATDKAGATVSDIFVIAVENVNDAPTLGSAIADKISKQDIAFSFTFDANTFIDIDPDDSLTYSARLKDGNNLPNWLKFNPATRNFSGTPTIADFGNLTIEVQATDNKGLSATDTFVLAVEDNNSAPNFKLSKIADDIFKISNSSGKSKIKVTLTERSSNLVNELGAFIVDDAQGNINGIAPGTAGYTQAALERSKVIFSAISNLPNGFNTDNLTHLLEFNSGENLRFYLVKNSTIDAVRAGVTPLTDILFSDPLTQKITDLGNDNFSLAWKDGSGNNAANFNNLVVKFSSTNDSLPLGTNLQGKPQGEVIDLRDITSQVKADFVVNRKAAFDNFIGFYQVADENGGIDTNSDGKADIFVGQAGYTEAAIRGRVAGIDLTVNNQGTATYTGTFQPASIFAPFIIVNGRPDALLDNNPNNNPAVYFPFLGANADKVDHIRLLGNNVFGFEDLSGGGDKDFNDAIVRVNINIQG